MLRSRSAARTPGSLLIITKHNYMGDTVVATPLLRAVRRAFPKAAVTLLTGAAAGRLLEGCPYVDRVISYDPRRKMAEAVRLSRSLRREIRPDVCLLADRSHRSAVIAALSGARVRVGFDTEGRGWLLTHRVPYDWEGWEPDSFLNVVRAVAPEAPGEPPYDPTPVLFVSDAERERGADILREREAVGKWLVGMQPGASYVRKQWPAERFAEVARELVADGAAIVLLGGKEERETALRFREALGDCAPVVDLTGETSLRETMGVLTNLALFLGNDTGVTHTAAALGVSTVSLFGPTLAARWGERGPRNAVLAAPDRDLSRLDAAPVLAAARRLLSPALGPEPPSAVRIAGDDVSSVAVGSGRS